MSTPTLTITNELLTALEAAAKAATQGPRVADQWTEQMEARSAYIASIKQAAGGTYRGPICDVYSCGHIDGITAAEAEANAQLITSLQPAVVLALTARIRELEDERNALRKGIAAVSSLIDNSFGVAGLHRNGDLAPWSELQTGGRFESWLCDFDAVLNESETAICGCGTTGEVNFRDDNGELHFYCGGSPACCP